MNGFRNNGVYPFLSEESGDIITMPASLVFAFVETQRTFIYIMFMEKLTFDETDVNFRSVKMVNYVIFLADEELSHDI